MKKVVFLILILSISFFSCTKDKSDDSYHITCTIDGTPRTFNIQAVAHRESNSINTSVFVHGVETASTNTADYGFVISNIPGDDEIIAGEYADSSPDFEILSTYKASQTTTGYEAGKTLFEEAQSEGVTLTNHFKIIITSINTETVKGTFSGDFYADADPHAGKKTITNGSFNVKFQ